MEIKMNNWILYAAGLLLMCGTSRQISDEYDLMPYSLLEDKMPIDSSSKDGFSALNFSDNFLKIPVNKLDISEKIISSPFVIYTVLKLYKETNEYMFSIENKTTSTMSLNFSPAEENITRITLSLNDKDDIYDFTIEDIIGKWIDLILFVEDDKVSLYIDCKELVVNEVSKKKEAHFYKDFNVMLGKSDVFKSVKDTFQGAIQKIKIYNNADAGTVKNICNGDSVLPDFTVIPMETEYYDDSPENILRADPGRGDGGYGMETPHAPEPEKGEKGEPGMNGMPGEVGPRGEKGEKGQKGDAGIKGEQGASIQGPMGPQGKRGDVGECECSESMVSSLLKIMPEMRGEPGKPGPRGEEGPRGIPGLTGNLGPQGDRGPEGLKGERGDAGNPGSDGLPGDQGNPGKDGIAGERGPPGPAGPPGPPGPGYMETEEEKKAKQVFIPGVKGDEGPIGPPGLIGPKGEKGDIGARGEHGKIGEKGDQGQRGLEGPRGEKGERGEAGEDGLPGAPGRHGKHGENGDKGDRGDKGAPGLAGTPASITELLDPDMDRTDNALIVEKLRGFKGDRGEKGEQGIKGDAGRDGAPGDHGKDGKDGLIGHQGEPGPKGEIGPVGHRGHKGDRGEPGPPGEIPASVFANLTDGNVKSLPGPTGARGPPGSKGQSGARGPTGYKGIKGDRGSPGPTGPIGPAGYNGSIGLKGDKGECAIPSDYSQLRGDKGDRGDPGRTGNTGSQGPAGQCSQSCKVPIIGPPGPPGPPGLSITGPKGEPGGFVSQSTIAGFTGSLPNHIDPNNIHGNSLFDDEDDDVYTANTVIYRTTTALIKRTSTTRPGTLAYVLQEKILLVRVDSGWQHVEMGPMFHTKREVKPNSYPAPPRPQFQHSSTTPRAITASTPRHSRVEPRHYIRLAALNDPHTGRVHTPTRSGHSAADYECNQQSLGYGYGGNFRAFLTNRVANAISMVERRERHLPVRNLKGEILFESWNSIFNGSNAKFVQSPVNINSFDGRNVVTDPHWPHKSIWHGSNARGERMVDSYCEEWDNESPYSIGMASSLHNEKMLNQDKFTCDNKLIVLCIEVSAADHRRIRHHPTHYIHKFPYYYGRRKT